MAVKAAAGSAGSLSNNDRLAPFHLLDDRDEQLVARPEVVQQHPVAGADRLGELAQRAPSDAAARERGDHRVEQLPAPRVVTRTGQRGAAARSAP